MDSAEFIEKLLVAMDPPEDIDLTMDTDLAEIEFYDSLAQLGIIVLFDNEFGVKLPPETLFKDTTVSALYQISKSNN